MSKYNEAEFQIGDFIKGTIRGNDLYGITDVSMTKARIISINPDNEYDDIVIQVLEHMDKQWLAEYFHAEAKYFDFWKE